jgi:hypothetical protein
VLCGQTRENSEEVSKARANDVFSKSSFRIDSLLVFSSTINGLAFDTITLFALTLHLLLYC